MPAYRHEKRLLSFERRLEQTVAKRKVERAVTEQRMARWRKEGETLRTRITHLRPPAERRVWDWIEGVHADGTALRIWKLLKVVTGTAMNHKRPTVPLISPDRRTWISLFLHRPGIEVGRRTGPHWGTREDIAAESRLKVLRPEELAALDAAIRSGRAWSGIVAQMENDLAAFKKAARGQRDEEACCRLRLRGLRRALDELSAAGKEGA